MAANTQRHPGRRWLSPVLAFGPSVILLKKRDNFASWETVLAACLVGVSAGTLAATLPAVTATMTTGPLLAPLSASYVAGYAVYGCAVSAMGGLSGIAAEMALNHNQPTNN